MPVERNDIDLVMNNFGCNEVTAISFIEAGINLQMLRDGVDNLVEPEINLSKEVFEVSSRLSEAVGKFQQDA